MVFLFFGLFRDAPAAYGSSQVRSRIGAASLHNSHSNAGSKLHLLPTPQLTALSKARDWTCILMDTSRLCYHWAMMGTPKKWLFLTICYIFLLVSNWEWCFLGPGLHCIKKTEASRLTRIQLHLERLLSYCFWSINISFSLNIGYNRDEQCTLL